ncbi:MAG: DNA protecting protein DprA [Candidatus Wildermuthbacteria bacterium RIFCSPHIGHO2_02_FULL_47_12]|uniref:DNA protecting protein DprA n=2 Tax=Parcubacteria group TaxID=1794811 RepID=A0A1G2R528_9BACT|nr:MAG: DNA protecting protein DprA [Candidatus Buchananbacteria bacterium RIFCSPLOWO2_01_FULL_46_12]OHA67964.1 MAG: DNA protecting protein DprA [Candidatus Wildermuthbacteria bacterium RIFCSPHIGHO2_02_FULL_47_12]
MSIFVKHVDEYPGLLEKIGDAPKQLYYRGEWNPGLFEKCLAVVGTRRMTQYGKRVTEQLVGEVAAAGVTIVSGFMYGVDATAHKAALGAGGKTIAVMPCGIDVIHPAYQADLCQEILDKGGLVLSEYEGTHPATNWTFPRRNRIVAGLSKATLVVEAGEDSGALITANLAKKYGRKVFAVPNPLTSAVSQGVNQLLKEGAELVGSAKDILQYYGLRGSAEQRGTKTRNYAEIKGELEQKIVQQLDREPLQIDELARRLLVSASQVGAAVSMLQLDGVISEEQGKFYAH